MQLQLFMFPLLLTLVATSYAATTTTKDEYMSQRANLIKKNDKRSFASSEQLNQREQQVDNLLIKYRDEFSWSPGENFIGNQFFHDWDKSYLDSKLFKMLKPMPKGGALHLHSGSSGDVDWIVEVGMFIEGCFVYWPNEGDSGTILKGAINFFPTSLPPPEETGWATVQSLVAGSASFQEELKGLITSNGSLKTMDSGDAWSYFSDVFVRIGGAMNYLPFYKAYLINSMEMLVKDNVMHMEIRALCGKGGLGDLVDEDNVAHSGDGVIDVYRQALREFNEKAQEPFTMKLIVASLRKFDPEKIEVDVEEAWGLKERNGDLVVGFDLVAEEDAGHTTLDYIDVWLEMKNFGARNNVSMPLFFHDGETNSRGNENLYDAVLLDVERVGHGLNLYYFPELEELAKKKGICFEINPISNNVLRYVDKQQLHPVVRMMANGVNVVVSSDDPGVFGYTGLSHDFLIR